MAWIEGTHEETFVVDAPHEEVAEFFCDPAKFQEALGQVESAEETEEGVWHWVLEEKAEKGIKYQADYTVKYERDGDTLTWHTLEGNMKSEGKTVVTDLGGGQTEVEYKETIATDLPIPKLMAKVFKPIVAREIAGGVGDFLEKSRELLQK
jgi:uncharacterized membrane protein